MSLLTKIPACRTEKTGRDSQQFGYRARFSLWVQFVVLLRSRTAILREKVLSPYRFRKRLSEPLKTRLFLPLSRNKSASFPHALGCLSAGNALAAVRAVFDAVRA